MSTKAPALASLWRVDSALGGYFEAAPLSPWLYDGVICAFSLSMDTEAKLVKAAMVA